MCPSAISGTSFASQPHQQSWAARPQHQVLYRGPQGLPGTKLAVGQMLRCVPGVEAAAKKTEQLGLIHITISFFLIINLCLTIEEERVRANDLLVPGTTLAPPRGQ